VGSLHVLQPLEPLIEDLLSQSQAWRPAALSTDRRNDQFAIILGADYGKSLSSNRMIHLPSVHNSDDIFLGSAFLDYQFACFPNRPNKSSTSDENADGCDDNRSPDKYRDDYAKFFFEFSTGIQFSTIWLDSSDHRLTSSSKQITYQNIATLNYSFYRRFGFLISAEWDAPLDSEPLRSSRPYYANIAVFTGGLTYNYYPGKLANKNGFVDELQSSDRWSVSILYSYTAFDPFVETNQLQVRISYSF
jgi:hypothetical protein